MLRVRLKGFVDVGNTRAFITDKELCYFLGISQSTLSKLMGGFHRGRISHTGIETDIRNAKPILVGGYRRWRLVNLCELLGVDKSEILDAIG